MTIENKTILINKILKYPTPTIKDCTFPELDPSWKNFIKNLEIRAKPGAERSKVKIEIVNLDL